MSDAALASGGTRFDHTLALVMWRLLPCDGLTGSCSGPEVGLEEIATHSSKPVYRD